MYNFICIDENVANYFVSSTVLQTSDFKVGELLEKTLLDEESITNFDSRIYIAKEKGGLFLLDHNAPANYFLVIDLESAPIFNHSNCKPLYIFQKLLRFAVKYWSNQPMSISEKKVSDSSKFVVFPYPISMHTDYRISIESSPNSKRIDKRIPGKHLLVYDVGYDEGKGSDYDADDKNFTKALEIAKSLRFVATQSNSTTSQYKNSSYVITSIDTLDSDPLITHLGFNNWLNKLTKKQLEFVTQQLIKPEVIEGPAGSGKTLCLVLKCINDIYYSVKQKINYRAIFVAHSAATEKVIRSIFESNLSLYPEENYDNSSEMPYCNIDSWNSTYPNNLIEITTLQSWCGNLIGEKNITSSQFIDQDAMAAKEYRKLLIEESINEVRKKEYLTFKPFLSPDFSHFWENESSELIADMVQHEIAVMIKGRAMENLDAYKKFQSLEYNLPIKIAGDKNLVFHIFDIYRNKLLKAGWFDTDDVVLTALGHLQTPIWRRKRIDMGYNSVYIDETHLFNLNELSVFHFLTKAQETFPIAFSMDRSQAPGDRGITASLLKNTISGSNDDNSQSTKVNNVFRCSPEILALANCVTSSGASLFLNFEDPLIDAQSMFTVMQEKLSQTPQVHYCTDEKSVIEKSFDIAFKLSKELNCSKADIAIVVFSKCLLEELESYAKDKHKAIEIIKNRGDLYTLRDARKSSKFLLSLPDFIGGLEFLGCVLVGVDKGRFPPTDYASLEQSRHYINFRSHNQLYVAITRARYRLEIIIEKNRGISDLLSNAKINKLFKDIPVT